MQHPEGRSKLDCKAVPKLNVATRSPVQIRLYTLFPDARWQHEANPHSLAKAVSRFKAATRSLNLIQV